MITELHGIQMRYILKAALIVACRFLFCKNASKQWNITPLARRNISFDSDRNYVLFLLSIFSPNRFFIKKNILHRKTKHYFSLATPNVYNVNFETQKITIKIKFNLLC